jgi:hypothetical protein
VVVVVVVTQTTHHKVFLAVRLGGLSSFGPGQSSDLDRSSPMAEKGIGDHILVLQMEPVVVELVELC